MQSTINKIYYGEIHPCEGAPPSSDRYKDNLKTIDATANRLHELYPECKELLDTYTDALRTESQLESEADFARGFRLGVALIIDVFMTE